MRLRVRWGFVFLLALALGFTAEAQTFVFNLGGDQEVPPTGSAASGGCMGILDQPGATFDITCVHDVAGATVMHIHRGAPGVNGDPVFDLGDPTSPVTGTWTGMTPADISDLLAGNLYVNIHTAGRPTGEIRGQILSRTVDTVAFSADGAQVVPPNATPATASCTADLDASATHIDVSCTHDLPSPQAAHIHEAPYGQTGPAVFTFPSAASPLSASVPVTPQLVAGFAATFLYLDIHGPAGTESVPGAEIRGQIGTPPVGATTGTIRIAKTTDPSGGSGFHFSENITIAAGFDLNDGQTQTFAGVAPGTYTVTEDDPTASGYSLADVACDATASGDPFARTATITVAAGQTVTCTFRNVRTAPTDTIFVFHLSGDQETTATGSTARGGCMGRFDAGTSSLTLVCTHDVDDATVMHIHRGAAGSDGAVAFDLGDPNSPVVATWSGMTPADVADLLAGNLYVNIHTAGRPTGEIRGQILPRTVDLVSFTADGSQAVPPSATPSTGNCTADLDGPATSLAIQCTHDVASPDSAHVHRAPAGENGPIVFTFPSAASPLSAGMPMTPRLVADFAAQFLYLDIHGTGASEDVAPDYIRGQIGVPAAPPATGTIHIRKRTVAPGGTGFQFTDDVPGSPGTFTLDDAQTHTFTGVPAGTYTITESAAAGYSLSDVSCDNANGTGNSFARTASIQVEGGQSITCTFTNLQTVVPSALFVFHLSGDQEEPPVPTSSRGGCFGQFDGVARRLSLVCTHDLATATIMHIHRGAPQVNGDVVFDLGDPTSPVEALWADMSPANVADLLSGNLYVNIHDAGRPSGAIRGQLLPRTVDRISFAANASQEVPPTDSPATGSCIADLSDDATSVAVQCTHNVPDPTSIHLHDAPPGLDGPVIFEFPATSPTFAGTAPLTPRLVADFAAGFLYVNIHSADYTEGEIRGQLFGPAAAPAVADVPATEEWAALLLLLVLAGAGWWRMHQG